MKRLVWLLLLIGMPIFLVACDNEEEKNDQEWFDGLTNYEQLEFFMSEITITDRPDAVIDNLVLPRRIRRFGQEAEIIWATTNSDLINREGHVNRPSADAPSDAFASVRANVNYRFSSDYVDFDLTILRIPATPLLKATEVSEKTELMPGGIVNKDFLILPRVGDFNTSITWTSSDESIIDLEGNVVLPQVGTADKNITLEATFNNSGVEVFKEYNLVVTADEDEKYDIITVNDDRIKNVYHVNTVMQAMTTVRTLSPGDALVFEDGIYRNLDLRLFNNGTKENPIFIIAENPGQVIISGVSQIHIMANYAIVANLEFRNGNPQTDRGAIWLEGDHLRLTNIYIDAFELRGEDYKWVSLTGQYHEVDNCTFTGKTTGGSLLTIWRDDLSPQFHNIHHNQFLNYRDGGGVNGYETIRLGTSTYSQSDSYITVSDNYFEKVDGEIEIISIKSGRNLLRNNTFVDSVGHITARHGKNNVISDNVFLANNIPDTGGIRLYDGGHVVRNNYIEGVNTSSNSRAGILVHSGVNAPGDRAVLNLQWTPFNILIEGNTIVDSRQSVLFCGKFSHPAQDITFRNNLIVTTQFAIRYDMMPLRVSWMDNHVYSTAGFGGGGTMNLVDQPSGVSFSNTLIELTRNAQGLKLHEVYGAQALNVITVETTGVIWLRN